MSNIIFFCLIWKALYQWFGSFFQVGTKVPKFIGFYCKPSLKAGLNKMPDIMATSVPAKKVPNHYYI